MSIEHALDTLLKSYLQYYDVIREGVDAPFAAEAVFHSHSEQYFLTKSASLSESESHEYVFFATVDHLDEAGAKNLDEAAWTRGTQRVRPHSNHRNTDVTLVILAREITPAAMALVKKSRHYQSYRFGFQGWSSYRVIAFETSSGQIAYNRQGQSLKRLFRNINKAC